MIRSGDYPDCLACSRSPIGWLLVVLFAFSGGCSKDLPTEYGYSKGRSGTASINGLGALRQSFESNAWESRDLHRLNDRLQSIDALVWTPTLHKADESEAVAWFQEWLGERPRTLIYVLPDRGSEPSYWESARELAPSDQRVEYRRRYARSLTRTMTHWTPGSYDPQDSKAVIDRSWFRAERMPGMLPGWNITARDEPGGDDVWHSEPLLQRDDGMILVMRITPDDWDNQAPSDAPSGSSSQILVVAGGSLVTNYGMTTLTGQAVARSLIAHSNGTTSGTTKRVGFLRSGPEGVPVSDSDEPPALSGMELLTVWPLSLITMHLALIAIVACLIVLPIFGRPRRVKERSPSDFADHIRAIAALMQRTGGEAYAASRISDYFRRIRGETTGPWVLPETHDQPLPISARPDPPASVSAGTLASHPEPVTDESRVESSHDPTRH